MKKLFLRLFRRKRNAPPSRVVTWIEYRGKGMWI
jgi:hypothetical protein